jgi:drug/metabolite transporter (DMT)-like permease
LHADRFLVGIGLVLVTVLSWAGTFPVGKSAVAGIDPFWLAVIRYLPTAAFFAALLAAIEGPRALRYDGSFRAAATIGVVGFGGFNLFAFIGLQHTSAEHVALVNALQTPIMALAHWAWRGVRPTRFTLGCIVLALVGVALVVTRGDPVAALHAGSLLGDVLALCAGICWVVYVLGVVKLARFSALRYTALTALPGAVALTLIAPLMTALGWSHAPDAATLVAYAWQIAYLIVFTSIIGVLCWNAGIQRVGPLNAVLLANLVPVLVFAIGAARGARFAAVEVVGGTIVIAALVANNVYLRRQARAAAPARIVP